MKITLLFFISYFSFFISYGQNLVPNYSFEIKTLCPDGQGQVYKAIPWTIPTTYGTPEYFHECSISNSFKTPDNVWGYQYPRTGKAYVGIYAFNFWSSEAREYIEVKLNDTLVINKKYCVVFFVNLPNDIGYTVSKIGMYFSKSYISNTDVFYPPSYTPQILNPPTNLLSDTLNWMKISGEYTAVGGELYITIGNFFPDNVIDTVHTNPNGTPISYYYIDDVYVYSAQDADAGKDTVTCPGEYVLIGTPPALGLKYRWSPSEGLYDTTKAQTFANPNVTTTYYLTVTDTLGNNCIGKGTDTVTVYVYTPPVNSGTDTTICKGKSLTIGSPEVNGFSYQWQPSEGLNNPFAAQPTAAPGKTTTYILTVTDTAGIHKCINKDTVSIFVEECAVIVPSVLYRDDRLIIKNLAEKSGLKIYNSLGQLIFTKESYGNEFASWMVSEGTYYYELNFANGENKKGKILVIK